MDRSLEFTILMQNVISTHKVSSEEMTNEYVVQHKFNLLSKSLQNSLVELENLIDEISPEFNNTSCNPLLFSRQHEILKQDRADHETQKCIETCHMKIVDYFQTLNSTPFKSSQIKLHFNNTVYLIEQQLKRLIDTYTKMRSLRFEKYQHLKKSFRFSSHLDALDVVDREKYENSLEFNHDESCRRRINHSREGTFSDNILTGTTNSNIYLYDISVVDNNSESMLPESILELENQQLVHEMKTEFDEIKSIQLKLHEISQLQHIFSEEVLKQKEEVEVISDLTVESAVNITEGNKLMRKAVQSQFTPDGVVLFVIVMFTVALWFLDWYQD